MKISKWVIAVLAAVIFVGGSAWAGEGCCKARGQKKDGTCQKADKDKKCKDPNEAGSAKKAEEKPAA
jgi:hypothetical protein